MQDRVSLHSPPNMVIVQAVKVYYILEKLNVLNHEYMLLVYFSKSTNDPSFSIFHAESLQSANLMVAYFVENLNKHEQTYSISN